MLGCGNTCSGSKYDIVRLISTPKWLYLTSFFDINRPAADAETFRAASPVSGPSEMTVSIILELSRRLIRTNAEIGED